LDVRSPQAPLRAAPFIIAAIVVAALYAGRELFVPLALAILLSFILAPLVQWLRRRHVGRVFAVVIAMLLAILIFIGLGVMLTRQVTKLAAELPRYEYTIREKVQRVQDAFSRAGVVENASSVIKGVSKELEKSADTNKEQTAPPPVGPVEREPPKPIPVEVHQAPPTPVETVRNIIGPLLKPATIAGIVLVFVGFILLQREDLRDRLIRLFGTRDLQRTTVALDDAAYRLSRYFLTQLGLNAAFGAFIAIGLFAIGVPSAPLWGIVAMLMRFVPYVGGFIAAGGPTLLALAVDPGWSMALSTLVLFMIAEPFMGQVVEPWVYGHSTGVSSLAIIVAAMFWTLLWGPVGLLLSTPLTVCLVVLGRHVNQLQFLDVLLGDRPALAPQQTFYQRLLAGDPIEIVDQAESCMQTRPLIAYYDDIALKGLALAQQDVNRGLLDADAQSRIAGTMKIVIDDLAEHSDEAPPSSPAKPPSPASGSPSSIDAALHPPPVIVRDALKPEWRGEAPLLCVAGANALDEVAAAILAQVATKHGIGARVIAWRGGSIDPDRGRELGVARLVCLSFLDPAAANAARYFARRIRRHAGESMLVLGFWGATSSDDTTKLAAAAGVDRVVTSLRQALDVIIEAANNGPMPANESTQPSEAVAKNA
jgi:predicted PurR-regulated permease PerM